MNTDNTNTSTWLYGGEPVTAQNAAEIAKDLALSARRASNDTYGNPRWYIWRGPFQDEKPAGAHWTRARSCFAHGPGYYVQAGSVRDLTDTIYRAIIERLERPTKGGDA